VIILGVNETSHDASLSLIKDGKILFAGHAERYSKQKNDWYINDSLIKNALQYGRPDYIAYYEKPLLKASRLVLRGGSGEWKPRFELPGIPRKSFSHHYSHAAAGYYTSNFNDAVIVEELEKKDREKKEEEEAKQRAAFQDSTRSKIIDGAGRGAGVGGLLGKGKKVGSGLNRGKGTKVTPDGILSSESPINSQKSKVSMGMMGGGANSMNAQLEELLYQQNAESVKSEYSPTTNRNKFPREIARPVERIIAIYNDPKTDLYDVLEIGRAHV
jgi:hypothetical protein